ncbi:hypothetical protein D9602_18275 [Sphingomonas sp. TX0522]|nr:hypothetical protein [Sphingomonas sp. TX0522]
MIVTYAVKDSTLSISPAELTMTACPPGTDGTGTAIR